MNSAALKRIYLFSVPFPATFMIPGGAVHHCARAATTFVLLPSPPPPVYTRCTGAGCDKGIDFRPSFHPYSTQTRDSRNLRHGFLVSLLSVDYGSLTDSPESCGMCVTNHSFRWHPASALHIPADGHRTENKHERASGQFIRGCADGWESLP